MLCEPISSLSKEPYVWLQTVIEDDVLKSTYQSANIYKGTPHEVVVKVTAEGCVLTWDFDILKVFYFYFLIVSFSLIVTIDRTILGKPLNNFGINAVKHYLVYYGILI